MADGDTTEGGGPLADRVVLLTGWSRSIGIGDAIGRRLLAEGARVLGTGWHAFDEEMPWGRDPADLTGLPDDRFAYIEADLADPEVPERLVRGTIERFGAIDAVVADHARSSDGGLDEVTAEELDRCWAVNTRASLLLAQALGRHRGTPRPGGRVIFFTSGQHQGPMASEIAYAVTKGAIREMTLSVADALADLQITVNCVNPGPVDTGYASGALHEAVRTGFPAGRWGRPDDVANLVAWLLTDDAGWITGQTIDSTGGWRGAGRP